MGIWPQTVGKWRRRFVERRLEGLVDEPQPGAPRKITDEQIEQVVAATLERTPAGAAHWSRASMAAESGLSASTVGRIWKAFRLKPHQVDTFKLSNDPQFIDKVRDVVGLYLDPPDKARCGGTGSGVTIDPVRWCGELTCGAASGPGKKTPTGRISDQHEVLPNIMIVMVGTAVPRRGTVTVCCPVARVTRSRRDPGRSGIPGASLIEDTAPTVLPGRRRTCCHGQALSRLRNVQVRCIA
ncbi:hypothetical protein GCM10029978_044930 [Actinoallomurus acanthiterrae]